MNIAIPVLVLFIAYGVYSIMHLVFCFIEKDRIRRWTKPFCMLLLAAGVTVAVPGWPIVYIPFYLGAVGDFFLLKPNKKRNFFIGTSIFLAAHICLLLLLGWILDFNDYRFYILLFVGLAALAAILFIFNHKLCGVPTLEGNFYMLVIVAMIALSIILLFKRINGAGGEHDILPAILLLCGYLSFFVSDVLLISSTYLKDFRRRDFPIMLFYLAGQFMIAYGFILLV